MRSFRRARRSGSTGVAAAIVAVASIWVTASNAQSPFSARVVLYEEDKTSVGQSFIGSVTWQLEPASSSSDAPAIRADITIPDRRLVVTWLMQRNDDSSLPASHTISLAFKVPTDFPHLGIAELRGILMKESERTRGVALTGVSRAIFPGSFVVRLSPFDFDRAQNFKLLRRAWIDLAIVYRDDKRAILAVAKGDSGQRAFGEAFAAWGD